MDYNAQGCILSAAALMVLLDAALVSRNTDLQVADQHRSHLLHQCICENECFNQYCTSAHSQTGHTFLAFTLRDSKRQDLMIQASQLAVYFRDILPDATFGI